MIDLINWENLRPYSSTQNKSFEELCFQICIEEYQSLGTFVRIDDSGGGDGVEYYLEFPNGDIWGWQCKFFGRFDESGRKEQIKKSLQTAYNRHNSKLKKWVLCSKNSMTNDEKNWLDGIGSLVHKGNNVLPDNADIKINHWGDSILLNYSRKYPSIHKFFFTDKILDENWFQEKFDLVYNSNVIKTKYLDNLHTKGDVDDFVTRHIGGKELVAIIEKQVSDIGIEHFQKEYNSNIKNIKDNKNKFEFNEIYEEIKKFIFSNDYDTIVDDGVNLINEIKDYLLLDNHKLSNALEIKIDNYKNRFRDFYELFVEYKNLEKLKSIHWDNEELELTKEAKNKIKECRETLLGPYFTIHNYDYYLTVFEELSVLKSNEIHISGDASKGKTHISVNIIKEHLERKKPAIFIFGKNLKTNSPLKVQLKDILDLPADWSFSDFLSVLNISGRINNTKAILLIDGLNEAIYWKSVWGDNLEELINEIKTKFPNILIITTFRTSYKRELFSKGYFNYSEYYNSKEIQVNGFSHYNVNEAIDKYFKHYNIKLENHSGALNSFSEPLYLKIFCETKKGLTVSFQNEDLFDVFDEYLIKCNQNITLKLNYELKFNKKFSINILEKISNLLWENSSREIDFDFAINNIITQEQLLVFEKEDLLIFRDWNNVEVITFTYDLLSGYLIAKKIIDEIITVDDIKSLLLSEKFKKELLIRETFHPLFNDILRCFCVLAIKRFGLDFYELGENKILDEYILNSIFEVNRNTIIKNKEFAVNIIHENFKNIKKHNLIYSLFESTYLDSQHPLNIHLLSDLLFDMKVSDRDLSWSEYNRMNNGSYDRGYKNFIKGFQIACESKKVLKTDKVHLAAKKVMWLLTSTNRELRDLSTRALYYYGRKCPNQFLELVEYSLSINDPYVWERTLASLYGAVLAKHNDLKDTDFKEIILPLIVDKLYKLIFKEDAPFSTTHILARDYASKCIEIGIKHKKGLLSLKEIKNTKAPYKFGGNRNPKEFKTSEEEGISSEPISMDFSNYTIGRIVKNGHSYSNPPEKKKVRRQIYWRIYNLGWNKEQFDKVNNRIREDNYHSSRSEQPNIERYGKKYSWIAYFEIAGLQSDKNLLDNDWERFRLSDADIDPTFPIKQKNKKFIVKDYLGDRNLSLIDWYKDGGKPAINEYLKIDNLQNNNGNWICLDGFIVQEDKKINREVFSFIRGLLIKDDDYSAVVEHLTNIDFGRMNLPDVRSNYYSFAGELFSIEDSTVENLCELRFDISRKKVKVKKGEPGYFHNVFFENNEIKHSFPKFAEIDRITSKEYEVLLPVMSYNWEGHHSVLNDAGHETIVARELANHLKLIDKPQTFNLFDENENLASQNIRYHKDFNNNHHFVYLREDLLNKFLLDNNYKLVWAIWGERQVNFKDWDGRRKFHSDNDISDLQIFSEVIEYNS